MQGHWQPTDRPPILALFDNHRPFKIVSSGASLSNSCANAISGFFPVPEGTSPAVSKANDYAVCFNCLAEDMLATLFRCGAALTQ